ncbi:MAG: exopolyphosphatase [Bacteroidota bacterium]
MDQYAVIDLGTNTFHLLVVEPRADGSFREILREQQFIKLAEDGIAKIGSAPFARGLNAMASFKDKLDKLDKVQNIKAFGTAGLRTASNGQEFVKAIFDRSGIQAEIISGQREAGLIHQGVMQAIPPLEGKSLIMDIGGGSVEFILADQEKVYWAESFPIGVAVLFNDFHHSDPISQTEIDQLNQHLRTQLHSLIEELQHHQIKQLIGASGTFDVIANLLSDFPAGAICAQLDVPDFHPFYQQLLQSTQAERFASPDIPDKRADMIVVAVLLIHFVLKLIHTEQIVVSAYAMKEGMIREMIQENSTS